MDKPFEFTPGEYLTRDGRKAVVLCTDAPGEFPIMGYAVKDGKATASSWQLNGSWGRASSCEFPTDLMPPAPPAPEKVVRWVTMYQKSDGSYWTSTDKQPAPRWANCVGCTRVVLTPGQFDAEDTPSEWDQAIEAAIEALRKGGYGPAADINQIVRAIKRGNGHA